METRRPSTLTTGPDRALAIAHRLEQASLLLSKRLEVLNLGASREAWTLAKDARSLAGAIAAFHRNGPAPGRETWSSLRGRLLELESAAEAFLARPDLAEAVQLLQ